MDAQERKLRFELGEEAIQEAVHDALQAAHPDALTTSEVLEALGLPPGWPVSRAPERRICEGVLERMADSGYIERMPRSAGNAPYRWRHIP